MYLSKDIIKKGNPLLKEKSIEVKIPLCKEDKDILRQLNDYVKISEVPELVERYQIRPGVGIAAIQIGIKKRMFAMNFKDFLNENKPYSMALVNPKIVSKSKEMTYLPGGEGCLSVDEDIEGLTPRHLKITIKAYLYDFSLDKGRHITTELTGYPAIVFQHEFDHLEGILFTDKIYEDLIDVTPLFTIDSNDEDETN